RLPIEIKRLLARIGGLPFVDAAAFNELGVYRHFHFQNVDIVLRLRELLHRLQHDLRLVLGVFEALLVAALRIVSDEFKEERDLIELAFRADSLDERVLDIVHVLAIERRVINEDLDRVRTLVDNAFYRFTRKQVGEASGLGIVVAALFIGQQKAGIARAGLGGGEAEFGI